jgi:nucleotide-binding universal stress UspA family protein
MLRASGLLSSRMRSPGWRFNPPSNIYVRAGSPTRALIQTMWESRPDLIVLGRHRRSAWDCLAGTMAARVLNERKCPVLIVDNVPRAAYRNILLALDGTKVSPEALRAAESLVVKKDVRATIVHAYRPPYDGALSSIGIAGDVVPRYSGEWSYDARSALQSLLMNAGRSRFGRAIFGSVANRVMRTAGCDCLVGPDQLTGIAWRPAREARLSLNVISGA